MPTISPARIECPRCGGEILVPLVAELGATLPDGTIEVRVTYDRDDLEHACRDEAPRNGKRPGGRRPSRPRTRRGRRGP